MKKDEKEKSKVRLSEKLIFALRRIGRVLISRYTITLVIILLELLLVEHLFITITDNLLITTAAVFVLHAVAFVHLVNRNTNPEYKVTWMAVLLIPVAGVFLYFLFFERRLSDRETELLLAIKDELTDEENDRLPEKNEEHYGIVRALLADDKLARVYHGTTSTFFPTGEEYFEHLIADIKEAKRFIFLEYFIIEEGELWQRILTELKKKAREGVDVRVLYDDIGCMQTLSPLYERYLRQQGISAYRFGRVTPKLSSIHNNRDHRKIAVIDGKIGYTGGVNIADEYVNIKERFGHWKDGGIRLSGNGALGLTRLFLSMWDYTVGYSGDYSHLIEIDEGQSGDGGIYLPFGSGPAPIYKEKVGKNLFINIINRAEQSICITTPYLIVDYELTEALCKASRRGVDVRIITPGIADKKIIKIMTKSSYPYLMKSGVKIYEYLPGFIHEKTLIADGKYMVVGTINLDYRSLIHHFEDGVLIIDSPVILATAEAFEQTIEKSDFRDNEEAKLNIIEWALRNIIRIFAPLL